jgi:polysaccharide biosynthesis transport protein
MSRNFELLQRVEMKRGAERNGEMGLDQEQPPTPVLVSPPGVAEAESAPTPDNVSITLDTDVIARGEILRLVQRLFLQPNGVKVVTFTGVAEGDGCTWLTARAAELLASQTAASVCVVDGNLHAPGLHQCFGLESGPGLTDAIIAAGPIGKYSRGLTRKNLWLLSGGSTAGNGHAWMSSELLRSRIAELRATFDFVLIDSPIVRPGGDAIAWGRLADGAVLVLGANATHRETARRAAAELSEANVRVLGGVLNKRTFPIPKRLYSKL